MLSRNVARVALEAVHAGDKLAEDAFIVSKCRENVESKGRNNWCSVF